MEHMQFSDPSDVLRDLTDRYPALLGMTKELRQAFSLLRTTFQTGGKLLACGNGGSAADALHIVGELMKSFCKLRPMDADTAAALAVRFPEDAPFLTEKLERTLPAVALVENAALNTAVQNDTASKLVFAQQVYGLGRREDCLLCISTSGNAKNCVYAAETAKAMGMPVIALTGAKPSALSTLADCTLAVPEEETYRVQELHLPVYHALCLMLECYFFGGESV